jgi:uncharacterized protein
MRVTAKYIVWWTLGVSLSVVNHAAVGDLRLLAAARHQDKTAVRELLKEHVDVNARQPDGATALHWAAHWDDVETADMLIRAGADVNAANVLGVRPIYLACENGSTRMVERLLADGATSNASLPSGETSLMTAARAGSVGAVKALLAHGADVQARETADGQTALMWSVAEQHPEVVRLLIEVGADVKARSKVRRENTTVGMVDEGGYTPLLFAARQGDLASARLLVAAGADVNDTAPIGTSALVVAAHSGHGALAAFLLEKGADANTAGAGYTALHAAIVRGDLDLIKLLLARGADPKARFTKGTKAARQGKQFDVPQTYANTTPFFLAAKFADANIMRALVDAGADPKPGLEKASEVMDPETGVVRRATNGGTTPLMVAAGLLTGGLARVATDRHGRELGAAEVDLVRYQNPDERRILNSGIEAVKLCVELGADVNATNEAGDTAMHGAALHGFVSVVQFLAEHGAKVDVKNKRGRTPMMVAASSPDGDGKVSIDVLRKFGAKE